MTAAATVVVWSSAWKAFGHRPALPGLALLAWVFGLRHGVDADHIAAIDNAAPLNRGGLPARLQGPVLRGVRRSWHMYPVGLLLGLCFDTATDVGVLRISARQSAQGLSPLCILVFPALFTAGMSFIDAADGVLRQGAYHGR